MRFASLPWYDLAEVQDAHDRYWRGLAERLRADGVPSVPRWLERDMPYERQWQSSKLLLSQACGYDVVVRDDLQVVATPVFDCDGCDGPTYRSFIIVRRDDPARALQDLRGRPCAFNTPTSHSGHNVLRALLGPDVHGTFSGAHESSLRMLTGGDVDVAAIDCVTHSLLLRHRPDALARTRILHRTAPAPAPPFVTSATTEPPVLEALRRALRDVPPPAALHLRGVTHMTRADYEPMARAG